MCACREKTMPEKTEFPKTLDTTKFRQAWAEYEEHRRQIRKKLTPLATKKLINKLETWGHDRSVLAIEHSIANGWTGIFEPGNGVMRGPGRLPAPPGKYAGKYAR